MEDDDGVDGWIFVSSVKQKGNVGVLCFAASLNSSDLLNKVVSVPEPNQTASAQQSYYIIV